MRMNLQIPGYSRLSHKGKQWVHMAAGGIGLALTVAVVSGMIGGSEVKTTAPSDLPKPKAISSVPGGQLDPKEAWMGGAGKELAKVKDELKQRTDELTALRSEQAKDRELLRGEMKQLQDRVANSLGAAGAGQVPTPTPAAGQLFPMPAVPAPVPGATNGPATFPSQRGIKSGAATAPGTFPPGSPGMPASGQVGAGGAETDAPAGALMRVSMRAGAAGSDTGDTDPSKATANAAGKPAAAPRTVSTFLPVGFTQARLLGGLAAPTGGQAQSNPVPVLLRLVDLAVLPNGFRGQVKDCLVVAEGFGDQSAERAYIRTTLLSCVLRDGRVLEVPIKGSVFGEDGMNGVMGKLVTKQGAILTNALMAGIASGIGSGIAQASQVTSSTTLGPINSSPTDTAGILRQGVGTGVGKALDRLAQYYISLAERTFPVIEVQPGRLVDVVIQQGVTLDVALGAIYPAGSTSPTRGTSPDADRSGLLRAVRGEDDE